MGTTDGGERQLERPEVVELDEDKLLFRQGISLVGQRAKTGGVGLPESRFREESR